MCCHFLPFGTLACTLMVISFCKYMIPPLSEHASQHFSRCSVRHADLLTSIHALIVNKVDYCWSLLADVSRHLQDQLQMVLNTTAALMFSSSRFIWANTVCLLSASGPTQSLISSQSISEYYWQGWPVWVPGVGCYRIGPIRFLGGWRKKRSWTRVSLVLVR